MNNKLVVAHPNPLIAGSRMEMELVPAHDGCEGGIIVRIMNQISMSLGYEWNHEEYGSIMLKFFDVAAVIKVLEGDDESVQECKVYQHFFNKDNKVTLAVLRVFRDPKPADRCLVELKYGDDRYKILLTRNEAMGISISLKSVLYRIVFG